MMINMNDVLLFLLYIAGCTLLVTLTVLSFKVMNTLKKVDDLIEDLTDKSEKLDGVFTLADRSADALNSIVGSVSKAASNMIVSFAKRRKERKEEKENEQE